MREIASMWRCDINLIISRAERELLQTYYGLPESILHYCPFLISNTDTVENPTIELNERRDFVFIGNYRHAPNWDAVQLLAQHIWPLIHAQLPQAKCYIYGAYTPEKAQQFHQPKQGIFISGWAKDAQATMQAAKVHLAPLRFGAGLKGKIFDSLRVGTPCVASSIAWEGIASKTTNALLTPKDYQNFAKLAVALYTDEKQWHAEQARGYQILKREFTYTKHSLALKEKIKMVTENLETHRAPLFTRKMFEQTQYRATQFMSQWIEAKQTIEQLRAANHQPETD
jgi:glycosyltransferase involved in cell wall biosynthesis